MLTQEMINAANSGKSNWRGTCPSCGYKKSVSVMKAERSTVGYCFACGKSFAGETSNFTKGAFRQNPKENRNAKLALELWSKALPLRGTLGEKYLRTRWLLREGDELDALRSLRYLPKAYYSITKENHPCVIALVQRVQCANPLGVQRIFLRKDGLGRLGGPSKRSLGKLTGGAVRLGECGATLGLSEGIETGLSFQRLYGVPTWACLSTSGLVKVELPALPLARKVVIAADHDGPGLDAAERLAKRLYAEGRQVSIIFPPELGMDFNDLILGAANG